MNFLSMKYFTTVARERSFTKAAGQLHITQQTLSAHIASVEQELGCALLIRHVPLELTYAGQVFLRYAVDFQKRYSAMEQEVSDISAEEKGILRVGIAYTRGRTIMPELIAGYQKVYPKIEVRLIEATNDVLQQKLLNGEFDLAIANFPDKIPGVELKDFYEEELVLLISSRLLSELYGEHAAAVLRETEKLGNLSPLADCPFLLNRQEDIFGRIGQQLITASGFFPQVRAQSDNLATLLSLCVRGVGACFCSDRMISSLLTEKELASLHTLHFGDIARYQIKFGWLKQPYCWSMTSNFIKIASGLIH